MKTTAQKDTYLEKLGNALIGTWKISGEAKGEIEYKWLHKGLFLKQEFDITVFGRRIKGVEIIGRLRRPNEKPSKEIWSRAYIFSAGETYDYVYELSGTKLTIFFGGVGSDNQFNADLKKDSYEGAWTWPGGGYRITASRLK